MAYEKYTWSDGETITADKLNHMEDGIESGGGSGTDESIHIISCHDEEDEGESFAFTDESYEQIVQWLQAGELVVLNYFGKQFDFSQNEIEGEITFTRFYSNTVKNQTYYYAQRAIIYESGFVYLLLEKRLTVE